VCVITDYVQFCISYIIYHIVDLKRQNRLKVRTDKPKLKVKMQSVSDDAWKRLLEKPRFELTVNNQTGKMLWYGIPGIWASILHSYSSYFRLKTKNFYSDGVLKV